MLIIYFFIFIIGLVIGSFLNAALWRVKVGKSLGGRSMCVNCKKELLARDLVPLISFLLLRGKCRNCKVKISWQYPAVELVTALLFCLAFYFHQDQVNELPQSLLALSFARDWLFIGVLTFLFVYDARHQLLPDAVTLPAILLAFLVNLFIPIYKNNPIPGSQNLLIAILFGIIFFALQYYLTRGKGVGSGDIRFGALMGAMLGFPSIWTALSVSYILGAIFALGLIIKGDKGLKSKMALGPFLALGTLIVYLYGDQWLWFYRW